MDAAAKHIPTRYVHHRRFQTTFRQVPVPPFLISARATRRLGAFHSTGSSPRQGSPPRALSSAAECIRLVTCHLPPGRWGRLREIHKPCGPPPHPRSALAASHIRQGRHATIELRAMYPRRRPVPVTMNGQGVDMTPQVPRSRAAQ